MSTALYKALPDGNYVAYDPRAGTYLVVGAEHVPPLTRLRLSQPAAPPPGPKGDGGRKARALLLMAMVEFQRRAHRVGMPDAAQPYLDHLAKLAADPTAAKKAVRLSLFTTNAPYSPARPAARSGVDPAPYGYCPECRSPGVTAEHRINGNAHCSNGHAYPRKKAKFSYVGVPLRGEAAARLLVLGSMVRAEDLADDGREQEPHVTVRYGLHTADPADVTPFMAGAGPAKLWLGKVSVFRGAETGAPFDVVKVDVDSPDLRRLNAALAALPHTDTHPEYQPHATIAYVKAGLGDGYAARLGELNIEAEAPEAEFSSAARERSAIRLSWRAEPYADGRQHRWAFKAVGEGPDAGRVLYGADAQRAIERQQQRGTQAQELDKQAAPVTGKQPAAGDHPEQGYSHKDFQAKKAAAYKAASKVASLASTREDITADHLKEMAGHLPYLTVAQLRSVRARLNTAFDVSFGGKSRRAAMVESVMGHVRKELDRMDAAAGNPVVNAPKPLPEAKPEPEAAKPAPESPKLAAPAKKEPWEMTREELEKTDPAMHEKIIDRFPTYGAGGFDGSHAEYLKRAIDSGKDVPLAIRRKYLGNELKSRKTGRNYIEPHEIRKDEYVESRHQSQQARRKDMGGRSDPAEARKEWENAHRKQVEAAVAGGKSVPADVLADYPDLAVAHKPPAEKTAEPAPAPVSTPAPTPEPAAEKPGYHIFEDGEFVPVKGKPLDLLGTKVPDGFEFFTHQDEDGDWAVSESRSGLRIGRHYPTRKLAEDSARAMLRKYGNKLAAGVEKATRENGVSPRHAAPASPVAEPTPAAAPKAKAAAPPAEKPAAPAPAADPHVGRSWESADGTRKVEGIHSSGKYLVTRPGMKGHELLSADELDTHSARDGKAAEHAAGAAGRAAEFGRRWHAGETMPGNEVMNHLRAHGQDLPEAVKKLVQHDDTTVSTTSFNGRGAGGRKEAENAHRLVSEAMHRASPKAAAKPPRMFTGDEPLHEIVNPIDPAAAPEEKVRQLGALTAENKPKVDEFLKGLDAKFGTWSKSNVKLPASLLAKAKRPSIVAKKPWHDAEHIRDSFRFKTVLKDARDLPGIIEHLEQHLGARVIKRDVDKFLQPGDWGWRITAFDLQMPNGQLVEYYLPVEELEAAKDEGGNHHLFEKWRNDDWTKLSPEKRVELQKDLAESNRVYQEAFDGYLKRSGATESDLRAAMTKVSVPAAGTNRNGESSLPSSENAIPSTQDRPPSRDDAANVPSITTTRPSAASAAYATGEPSKNTGIVSDAGRPGGGAGDAGGVRDAGAGERGVGEPAGLPAVAPGAAQKPDDPAYIAAGRSLLADDTFRKNLADAYNHQTLFVEHRDGLVPFDRVYHELVKRQPNITVDQLHAALDALNRDYQRNGIEFHTLNEIAKVPAEERIATISRNDRNYHYARFKGGADAEKMRPPAPKSTNPHVALADALAAKLKAGDTLTAKDVFALADEHHGGTRAEGKYGPSDAYDSLETAFNKSVTGKTDPTADLAGAQQQARDLAERVGKLPTQTNRSGNKDAFQQFSTPPHYAFAANWVANLKPTDTVLEPSAGTGSLAIHAKNAGAKVVTNELDPRRAAFLKDQFGAGNVHGENGEQIGALLNGKVRPTAVVMNPPFSQTAGRMGDKKDLHAGAKHIEQGLQLLPAGGRCVAIVGRGMTPESPTYRKWFAGLAKAGYTLSANVGVAGGEYKKYGTSFDTRLLVIDKVPPADGHAPVTGDADDIPDLMAKLEGVRNARPASVEPAPVRGAGAEVPQAAGGAGGPDAAGAAAAAGGVPDAGRPGGAVRGGPGGVEGGGLPAGAAAAGGGGVDAGAGPGLPGGAGRGGPGAGGAGAAGAVGVAGGQPAGVQDGARGGKAPRGKSLRKPSVALPQLRPAAPIAVTPVSDAAPAPTEPDTTGTGGTTPKTNADLGDSLYETYKPSRFRIPGAKPHASPLVESAAMSAVQPPAATYRPHLSPDLIDQGKTVAVTNPDGSVQHISVGLSEAGLESVVYAGQAHQKYLQAAEAAEGAPAPPAYRRGYFIGDGTGAGKGRQIAGIMTDNWNQGRKKHVWVSQKQSLYNDAQRDWRDVGNDPAHVVHFDDIRKGKNPPAEGVAFITYDTLKSKPTDPAAPTNLDALVNWVGKDFDGVIAFDEAHTMANALDTEGSRGVKTASERALAGVKLQQMLPHARVVYVSATGATELSNLAYAERLGMWGRGTPFATKQDFIGQMEKGGVAAMEAVAQSLKATGGYAARSLSFDDGTPTGRVEYDRLTHSLSPEQHGTYDHLAEAWQKVLQNIGAALEATGGDKNGHAKAAAKSQFWGAQQRFFNQVMTSMQLPSVIKGMEADMAAGKAPVVQLVNTMEAATKRALARSEDGDLDNIDVSPKEVLMQYLQTSFPVHRFEEYTDENNNVKTRLVMGSDGKPAVDPAALKLREEMLDMVGALQIPESPIDQLLRHFGHEHVAEATGRSQRFVWQRDPETGEMKKTLERRGANANAAEARAFQNGQKKVMIFSDAGGTGSSYHADRNAKNQKQRVHYVLQPGWRADNAVQGLGRTHRTNQVSAPIFRLVEIEQLKAQKRFISTIARRLDQLGALTRGQRQAGSSGLFKAADNLESKEAREAMETFFRDLSRGKLEGLDEKDVLTQLGFWEEPSEEDRKRGKAKEPKTPESMGQLLNRLLSLKVDTQGQVFGHYERILHDTVERAAANQTLDTGVENFPADRVAAKNERVIHKDADSGAEAKLYTVAASQKLDKRPWKANQEGQKPLFFVRNKQSGRIWAVHQASSRTDAMSGQVHPQYRLSGPTAKQFRDQRELYHAKRGHTSVPGATIYGPGANWEKVEHDTAKNLWEQEYDAAPDHKETDEHFVTGAFLPIWDKIPGADRPRIYRVRTDDGKTVVGRHVPADQVEGLMRNLGLDYEGKKHTPADTHAAVARGDATARLSNGWTLHPVMVGGQRRIEVKGISPFALNEAVADGIIKERVGGYDTRLFVPTGPDGLRVLERVLKSRNATITAVTNKRDAAA